MAQDVALKLTGAGKLASRGFNNFQIGEFDTEADLGSLIKSKFQLADFTLTRTDGRCVAFASIVKAALKFVDSCPSEFKFPCDREDTADGSLVQLTAFIDGKPLPAPTSAPRFTPAGQVVPSGVPAEKHRGKHTHQSWMDDAIRLTLQILPRRLVAGRLANQKAFDFFLVRE